MEINKDNIDQVIGTDEFKSDLLPLLNEIEPIKTLVTNKAELIYKDRIDDEVKTIHGRYDDDMFNVLGERPGAVGTVGDALHLDLVATTHAARGGINRDHRRCVAGLPTRCVQHVDRR